MFIFTTFIKIKENFVFVTCVHIIAFTGISWFILLRIIIIKVNLNYSKNMILSASNQMKFDIYGSKNTDWDELKCKNILYDDSIHHN